MKNVIAYTRVSTDNQVDKFGLEAQREQIVQYCERNGLNIIEWISDDGESGAKTRPGFDKIIYGECFNPPVESVIVAKSDRVARDINVYYYYKMCLKRKRIDLISVQEDFGQMGVFSTMLEAFTMCVAQMERENINKRTSAGRKIKASHGGYSGGRSPFGYKVQDGCLVINEDEAKAVRKIFALRGEGKTLREIADELQKEGYKGKRGNPLHFKTVSVILENEPTYKGMYRYGNGEWVKGKHEPIL